MAVDRKNTFKGVLAGAAVGTMLGLAGFFATISPRTGGMGAVLFLLVPVGAGFAVAVVTAKPNISTAAAFLGTLATLGILIATGREGLLCAILALPIIATGLLLGIGIGYLFRRLVLDRATHQKTTTGMTLVLVPLVVLAAQSLERSTIDQVRSETITSSVRIPAVPAELWASIEAIDQVRASKPWLMYVGLPVPQRCTLQGRGVGAKRTCYFDKGSIEETVAEWDPPYRMRMTIDRTNMPGRHWMGFEDASYELRADGGETVLVRTTTLTSHLYPASYWRPLEIMGVRAEHEYILADISSRHRSGK